MDQADISAGQPVYASTTTDSAESDTLGKGTANILLEESPPTDGELEDAMSKIHDFFASEGNFTHLSEVIHSSIAARARPSYAFSKFGPQSPSRAAPPPSPGHRGDSLPEESSKVGGLSETDAQRDRDCPSPRVNFPQLSQAEKELFLGSEGLSGRGANIEVPSEHTNADRAFRRPHMQSPEARQFDAMQAPRALGFGGAREHELPEAGSSGVHGAAGVLHGDSPESPRLTADESPTEASQGNPMQFAKLRLGITPSGSATDRGMKYLHIHERGRDQFQQYAKALVDKLTVECAESNPYVKALCAHRQEMHDSTLDLTQEAVDSLASRLATERADNLATLTVEEEEERRADLMMMAGCNPYCHSRERFEGVRFEGELHLPELEARYQRRLRQNARYMQSPLSPTASTDRSTTARSLKELEARKQPRLTFPQQEENSTSLKLRVGRNRLELSEADKSDFLNFLDDACEPESQALVNPFRETADNVTLSEMDTSERSE